MNTAAQQLRRTTARFLKPLGLAITCLTVVACSSAPAAPSTPTAASKPAASSAPTVASKPTTGAAPTTAAKPVASTAPAASKPAAAPAGAQPGSVLRLAVSYFGQEILDPTLTESSTAAGYAGPLWDWLTTYTEGEGLKPGLALSWKQDGLQWTFQLRQGVKFHDGTEMTAEDVRFTLMDGFRRPEARSSHATVFKAGIKDVVVVDKYTVRIETVAPWPSLPQEVSNQPGVEGVVLPKAYIQKVGWQAFADAPMGTGPWKFSRRETGNLIEFDAFTDYWGGAPAFSKLRVLLVPEPATRQAQLQAKEVDVAEVPLDKLAAMTQAGFKTIENPEPSSIAILLFGTYLDTAGPMKDLRVRQALNYAVDRTAIIQSLFGGRGKPAVVYPVDPGRIGYPDDLQPYPFDLARAKQLLADAGQSAGFAIKIYSNQGPFMASIGEAVAGYWQAIGVRATVETVDIAALRPKYAATTQAADIIGNGWIITISPRLNGASDFAPWWTQSGGLVRMALDLDPLATEATKAATLDELDAKTKIFYRAAYAEYRAVPIAYAVDTVWAYGNQVGSIQIPRASQRNIQPSIHTAKPAA